VPGWGKLVTGVVLGAAGALYATNEEFRKALPARTRDLPAAVQRRFEAAAAAAREASVRRRAEILRELEAHGGTRTSAKSSEPPVTGVAEETIVPIDDVK
jgi:hypothetical protein